MKVLLVDVVRHVTHGGRGVPRPRPLGELTAPRGRPLNDDLTGNGLLGLDSGVTFGVVLGDSLGVTFGLVPGVIREQFRHVCRVPLTSYFFLPITRTGKCWETTWSLWCGHVFRWLVCYSWLRLCCSVMAVSSSCTGVVVGVSNGSYTS